MHDLDRLRLEEADQYEAGFDGEFRDLEDDEIFEELGMEQEDSFEDNQEMDELDEESGDPFASASEDFESFGPEDSPLTEQEEEELAAELSTIDNEDELNEFLKKAVKKIGGRVLKQVRQPLKVLGKIAQPVMPLLRTLARQAIPKIASMLRRPEPAS